MANRAYLYPSDSANFRRLERSNDDTPYYDSRHNFPVSWFFLFRPQDLVSIDVVFDGATWQEPKFIARREAALEVFEANGDLLVAVVGEDFDCARKLTHFSETLAGWSGSHLILDPVEVEHGGDSVQTEAHYARILDCIWSDAARRQDVQAVQALVKLLSSYSEVHYENGKSFEVNVIGYTYSLSASGTGRC